MTSFNRKNKIIFVGTGGGGSMVGTQVLSTGGMWWNVAGVDFYVDPGPGVIWHLRQSLKRLKLPVEKLQFIFVSHDHLDHANDLNALIEASDYAGVHRLPNPLALGIKRPKSRPTLLAPDQVAGEEAEYPWLSPYHRQLLSEVKLLEPQTSYQVANLELETTKALLEKPYYRGKVKEFGFWIRQGEFSVGYLPETYWSEGLFSGFHPKILVYNAVVWTKDRDRETMIKTIKTIQPELVILRHWVCRSVAYGLDKISQEFEKETGVSVLPARDFSVFDLKTRQLIEVESG